MQVRALRDGFYKGVRRREGSVFSVVDGAKSKSQWFVPVEVEEVAKPVEVEEVEIEKPRRGRPPKEVSNGKQ